MSRRKKIIDAASELFRVKPKKRAARRLPSDTNLRNF